MYQVESDHPKIENKEKYGMTGSIKLFQPQALIFFRTHRPATRNITVSIMVQIHQTPINTNKIWPVLPPFRKKITI